MSEPVIERGAYVERIRDGVVGRITRVGGTHVEIMWDSVNTNRAAWRPDLHRSGPTLRVTNVLIERLLITQGRGRSYRVHQDAP